MKTNICCFIEIKNTVYLLIYETTFIRANKFGFFAMPSILKTFPVSSSKAGFAIFEPFA